MKIYVIGSSKSGKTPFASKIAEVLGWSLVCASEWFRKTFLQQGPSDRQAFTDAITAFTIQTLREDPDLNLRYLSSRHDLSRPCVVEGFRNPRDFIRLFDYRQDRVVFLRCEETDLRETDFEGGIQVMRSYLRYLLDCGLLREEQMVQIEMARFAHIEMAAARYLATLPQQEMRELAQVPAGKAARIHAEVDPVPVRVRQEFLYDMDPAKAGTYVHGRIFSVSSYQGHLPTFQVLLDDGSVFSYLPAHALVAPDQDPSVELDAEDLTYHPSPAGDIHVTSYKALQGPVQVFLRRRDLWVRGRYVLTIDWHEGNDLLHLVVLDSGHVALLPQHKVKFGDAAQSLEPYRKLHQEWVAPRMPRSPYELLRLAARLANYCLLGSGRDLGTFGGSADCCNLTTLCQEGLGSHDEAPQVPLAEIVRYVEEQLGPELIADPYLCPPP